MTLPYVIVRCVLGALGFFVTMVFGALVLAVFLTLAGLPGFCITVLVIGARRTYRRLVAETAARNAPRPVIADRGAYLSVVAPLLDQSPAALAEPSHGDDQERAITAGAS